MDRGTFAVVPFFLFVARIPYQRFPAQDLMYINDAPIDPLLPTANAIFKIERPAARSTSLSSFHRDTAGGTPGTMGLCKGTPYPWLRNARFTVKSLNAAVCTLATPLSVR